MCNLACIYTLAIASRMNKLRLILFLLSDSYLCVSCNHYAVILWKKMILTYIYIAKLNNSICVLQLQPPIGSPSDDQAAFNPYVLQRTRGLIGAEKGKQSNLCYE